MVSLPKNCPVTLALIAVNILLFVGQQASQGALTGAGLLYGPDVAYGQLWRIVSSGFLHGSLIHIGFNMYLLYLLGPQLEQSFGSQRFSLMYFGSLLGGALAVLVFDFNQPTLGASGAVLGLAGSMAIVLWSRGLSPHQSPVFGLVALNLALPLLIPGISFWGHFGGVVAGALIGGLLVWRPLNNSGAAKAGNRSMASVAVLVLAAACLLTVYLR